MHNNTQLNKICKTVIFLFLEPSLVRVEVTTPWAIKTSSWTWNRWYLQCRPPTNTKRRSQTMVGYYLLCILYYTHTDTHTCALLSQTSGKSHGVSLVWEETHAHAQRSESVNWAADAPIPPSVLSPLRHQSQHVKNTPPMILPKDTTMPVCVCVCSSLTLNFTEEDKLCDITL